MFGQGGVFDQGGARGALTLVSVQRGSHRASSMVVFVTGEFLSGGDTVGHGSEWFGFQRGRAPYSNAESPIEVFSWQPS